MTLADDSDSFHPRPDESSLEVGQPQQITNVASRLATVLNLFETASACERRTLMLIGIRINKFFRMQSGAYMLEFHTLDSR